MQKWQIGNVTITSLVELRLPGLKYLLPDATPERLQEMPWLKPHFVTDDWKPKASVRSLILESQGQRIMVDTCVGNDKTLDLEMWSNRSGPYLADLAEAGFETESIDTVLCTHLHMDHVGWNTTLVDGKWQPTFPNAKYLFGKKEWDYWDANRGRSDEKMMEQSVDPILQAGQHELVATDHRVNDEIWLEPTPGHTPGHVSVRIASDGKEAVITGDLIHHPSQMARPHWGCSFDVDAGTAAVTRKDFLDRYADKPTLVIGTHFATPTAGHVLRDGDAWRFEV